MPQSFEPFPVVPVVTIERVEDALPLAEAVLAGGLDALLVTLRTPQALPALGRIARALPALRVGAATVLRPADVTAAVSAGARFLVSPGMTQDLAAAGLGCGLPFLPGVSTISEIMAVWELGFSLLNYYPAHGADAIALLRDLVPVFREISFCATGGITEQNAGAFLALPNVPVVHAGWIAPPEALVGRDWAGITLRARRARELAAAVAARPGW